MQRIADDKFFPVLSGYIFPDRDVEEMRLMVRNITTTEEFQQKVMYTVNRQFILRSMTEFSFSGLECLDPRKNYLFISNHRDIMLDSSLLQYLLLGNGFRTTEITFGSNLMSTQLVVDVGKANKMFTVIRNDNIRCFLKNSLLLSEYIRYVISEKGESVWIAQRNGRTKDGNDVTEQGIIKMFCMSGFGNPVDSLNALNIVPVAISYQIESCDILKTLELYHSRLNQKYVKQPGEDLNSILTGITQQKGRVNISICEPVTKDEIDFSHKYPNEFYKLVASVIDKRIYKHYKLYGNNYIAHDMRSGSAEYSDCYTPEEKEMFAGRCRAMLEQIEGDKDILTAIFLDIYAKPVDNAKKAINQ
ncbi:MAG: acyltransferase [Tannerella sp.]|nr:acyltransferase [Tannerella sp.]